MSIYQLSSKYQTGYSVVSCCALTFTVVTVHCNALCAYDDEWVHLCSVTIELDDRSFSVQISEGTFLLRAVNQFC